MNIVIFFRPRLKIQLTSRIFKFVSRRRRGLSTQQDERHDYRTPLFHSHFGLKSSIMTGSPKVRTKGADIADNVCKELLSDYVPMASRQPKKIWHLTRISKRGLTSQWSTVSRHYGIINAIIDRTGGRIPYQKKLPQAARRLSSRIPQCGNP